MPIRFPARHSNFSIMFSLDIRQRPSCSSAMTGSMPLTKSSTTWRGFGLPLLTWNPGGPMSNRLLDRQTKLLEFLTSGAVIFDDPGDVLGDYGLGGIDCGLLRLEARFSH